VIDRPQDNQDRPAWYAHGDGKEQVFVEKVAPWAGISGVRLHPKKVAGDPTYIDLLWHESECDLKWRAEPFFLAGERYGVDPQRCLTFNVKDWHRYEEHYPNWRGLWVVLDWRERWSREVNYCLYEVRRMVGVYWVYRETLTDVIERGALPIHCYKDRKHDAHNARDSYLVDLSRYGLAQREEFPWV
jgi:hypothetical protein